LTSTSARGCRRCREPILVLRCADGSRRPFDPTPVDVDPDTLVAAWAWRRRAGMESGAGRLIEHFPETALMLHCCRAAVAQPMPERLVDVMRGGR